MLAPLLDLPSDQRSRLIQALDTRRLAAPYDVGTLRGLLPGVTDLGAVRDALLTLDGRGASGRAAAVVLDVAREEIRRVDRPALVLSGVSDEARLHARETASVFDELLGEARRTIWLSTFALHDGPRILGQLAARLDASPDLRVRMLINIGRKHGVTTAAEALVTAFADRFWNQEWPGVQRPEVFYDPRSLALDGGLTPQEKAVLHMKALVVDERVAFVGSANLTEAAFERNYEAGVLSRDRALAAALTRFFRTLVEHDRVVPLPSA